MRISTHGKSVPYHPISQDGLPSGHQAFCRTNTAALPFPDQVPVSRIKTGHLKSAANLDMCHHCSAKYSISYGSLWEGIFLSLKSHILQNCISEVTIFPRCWWVLPKVDGLALGTRGWHSATPTLWFLSPALPICKLFFSVFYLKNTFWSFLTSRKGFNFTGKKSSYQNLEQHTHAWPSALPSTLLPVSLGTSCTFPYSQQVPSTAVLHLLSISPHTNSDMALPPVFWFCSFLCTRYFRWRISLILSYARCVRPRMHLCRK